MLPHVGPSGPQDGPKLVPSWPQVGPKLAHVGPSWSNLVKLAPSWPQDGPKLAQVGSCWPPVGPMMAHLSRCRQGLPRRPRRLCLEGLGFTKALPQVSPRLATASTKALPLAKASTKVLPLRLGFSKMSAKTLPRALRHGIHEGSASKA